jgi:hypothetical protein
VGVDLCDWLPRRDQLKCLDLWGNELGAEGCHAVMDGLRCGVLICFVGLCFGLSRRSPGVGVGVGVGVTLT